MEYKSFGNIVKQLREDRNLTLREVAEKLEIDTSMLGKIEKNSRKPSRIIIDKIAKLFDVKEKDLIIASVTDNIAIYLMEEEIFANEIFKVAEQKVKYLKYQKTNNQ